MYIRPIGTAGVVSPSFRRRRLLRPKHFITSIKTPSQRSLSPYLIHSPGGVYAPRTLKPPSPVPTPLAPCYITGTTLGIMEKDSSNRLIDKAMSVLSNFLASGSLDADSGSVGPYLISSFENIVISGGHVLRHYVSPRRVVGRAAWPRRGGGGPKGSVRAGCVILKTQKKRANPLARLRVCDKVCSANRVSI